MAYINPKMSSLFGSGACASQEPSAAEGWMDALNNPAYVRTFDVAKESATGRESADNTLTEAMAAAQISTGPAVSTTTSEPVRQILPRPQPPRLVMFQRGGPQALDLHTLPPSAPGWNSNEEFVYEGEMRPARPTPPPPPPTPTAEEELQVDAVAEETEEDEEEEEETRSITRWQNAQRARQVIALLDQDVLDSMSTDDLIWITQAGFQSLMSRRVHH